MVIVLSCHLVPFPRAPPKAAKPIVWWSAVRARVRPQIPVPFGIGPGCAALLEPLMLVRGMVRDKIEYKTNATLGQLFNKPVELLERPDSRVDCAEVRDVVTEVEHR